MADGENAIQPAAETEPQEPDPFPQERITPWAGLGAVLLVLFLLAGSIWYARRMAAPRQKPLEFTRLNTAPRGGPAYTPYRPPISSPIPSAAPVAAPMIPKLDEPTRGGLMTPVRQLLDTVKRSDAQKFWQGEKLPATQVRDAVDALGTHTTLVTRPERYPPSLAPYVRAVALEVRSYLKVTEQAASRGGADSARRAAAARYLARSDNAFQALDAASRRLSIDSVQPADEVHTHVSPR